MNNKGCVGIIFLCKSEQLGMNKRNVHENCLKWFKCRRQIIEKMLLFPCWNYIKRCGVIFTTSIKPHQTCPWLVFRIQFPICKKSVQRNFFSIAGSLLQTPEDLSSSWQVVQVCVESGAIGLESLSYDSWDWTVTKIGIIPVIISQG